MNFVIVNDDGTVAFRINRYHIAIRARFNRNATTRFNSNGDGYYSFVEKMSTGRRTFRAGAR